MQDLGKTQRLSHVENAGVQALFIHPVSSGDVGET